MKFKFILPALTEAESALWRPIKYSLFPPLGLATLAAYLSPDDDAEIVDQHVQVLDTSDRARRRRDPGLHHERLSRVPDRRSLPGARLARDPRRPARDVDARRGRGSCGHDRPRSGGGSVSALPRGSPPRRASTRLHARAHRTLEGIPPVRRDLIHRDRYLVPNSIVVTRGCPFHCEFCYKDAFFKGGRGFYTQRVDEALAEIERLPGRHLYFLDDHLLGNRRFASELFAGMRGMGRLFQGAATVDSILRGTFDRGSSGCGSAQPVRRIREPRRGEPAAEQQAAESRARLPAGHGSPARPGHHDQRQLRVRARRRYAGRLPSARWRGRSTAASPPRRFHIATPYPDTAFHREMASANRLLTSDWDLYDTRHVVFRAEAAHAPGAQERLRRRV